MQKLREQKCKRIILKVKHSKQLNCYSFTLRNEDKGRNGQNYRKCH